MKEIIEQTLKVLNSGGVILYPTDTVWGIGCDATNAEAVAKVYKIKEREDSKAMIMLLSSINDVYRYTEKLPEAAEQLFEASGEGSPITVIVPDGCSVAPNALPAEKTIALRIPHHDFCAQLLRRFRRPLVSTSANISGEPSPSSFDKISDTILNRVDYIVPRKMEKGASGTPSSIIIVSADNSIKIIR